MSEEKQANITIEVAPDGLHIRCEYTGAISTIPAAIERLRAAGVLDLVKPVGGNTPARKPAERVSAAYDGAGQPMCPIHRKPLSEGRYGLYCPSKAQGEHANDKGYCSLRFTE
jgi:hypothetical protein